MTCDRCGKDKDDVRRRNFWPDELAKMNIEKGKILALCTECYSEFPGRAWMKAGLQK